jgi:uncharacterized protein (TIGR02246 family)
MQEGIPMCDEQAIRDLVQTWLTASAAGDLDQILTLMSDDIVFLTAGQKPFGKDAFAATSLAAKGKVRVEATGDVKEVQVSGDMAFCWVHLTITLRMAEGGEGKRLAGYSLSVLRKQDGRWIIARDANLVTPEPRRQGIHAAVPVFPAASVARSIVWYRDVLGFGSDPFGPPDDPVFAILRRDGAERMLQKAHGESGTVRAAPSEEGWNAYRRVADIHAVREAVLVRAPDASPIVMREYGCQEFNLTDPDGHVLVIGQCG